jgi:hypothetical protein
MSRKNRHMGRYKLSRMPQKKQTPRKKSPFLSLGRQYGKSTKASFRASPTSVPRNRYGVGRDPWFDRLTTLSEVEGESRKIGENQIILDPGSRPAPWDLAGMTNCNTVSGRRGKEGGGSKGGAQGQDSASRCSPNRAIEGSMICGLS